MCRESDHSSKMETRIAPPYSRIVLEARRLLVERRRSLRYSVCTAIEIREADSSAPSRGNTTDVSLGGCYVAALFPLPAGATVDFTLWITDGNIKGHGSVQTCHPGVGMGIKFIDLTYQATRRLDDYLRASVSVPPAEAPQLYLR